MSDETMVLCEGEDADISDAVLRQMIQVNDRKDIKPDIIVHHSNTKGGVNYLDKMISAYSCRGITSRWPLTDTPQHGMQDGCIKGIP
ncbi:hypothetical protein T12_13800 [Trichinella patagoniensis]|uniref:Uncharacterized protein n=1 Tax=Trichinella patagoniensis TaxID=990121 RepID=A0A0V0ZLM7_9BILA|nr:hypothetical protein T12_13800 [Trichinella patagoniensis]